jgi:predicted dehydrogenase
MKIALVGTGFVADYYALTLQNYPGLQVAACWDQDQARLRQFCSHYRLPQAADLDGCIADKNIDIVVNLTTPESHFEINKQAIAAGKHVYCEKPLALTVEDIADTLALGEQQGVTVCSAPTNALSEAADAAVKSLKAGEIGEARLVYAEMEDGPVWRDKWRTWHSVSGAPWPGHHEFMTGCTLEHAGYALSYLMRLFGPVRHLSSASVLAFPEKYDGKPELAMNADFSVGTLRFDGGVTARLTCGLMDSNDRSLTIHGMAGTMTVADLWDNGSAIRLKRADDPKPLFDRITGRLQSRFGRVSPLRMETGRRLRYPLRSALQLPRYPSKIDFARGIDAQRAMIEGKADALFCGKVAGHLSEITLALNAGQPDFVPTISY